MLISKNAYNGMIISYHTRNALANYILLLLSILHHTSQSNSQSIINKSSQSILSYNIDPNSITITSYNYNPYPNPSDWIDRVFGYKSVHYHATIPDNDISSSKDLLPYEIYNANQPVKRRIPIEINITWPVCSIELLGYMNSDVGGPLFPYGKYRRPVIKKATLVKLKSSFQPRPHLDDISNINSKEWNCYYRALYENWKPETDRSKPNFWPIFFYCPNLYEDACHHMNQETGKIIWNLTMILSYRYSTIYHVAFTSIQRQLVHKYADDDIDYTKSQSYTNHRDVGICLSIPYASTDAHKIHANHIILQEWIRYYSALGFHMFIYDRDGAHKHIIDHLFSLNASSYPSQNIISQHLHYYDFTIRGLLDPAHKGFHYDNNELLHPITGSDNESLDVSVRYAFQGVDKSLTLTHCRFEAKAVTGIEDMMVIDYDEFLYCPVSKPIATSQASYIKSLIHSFKDIHVDQLTITQRILMNRTSSTRDCIISQVKHNQSIFHCIAPYQYEIGMHSYKSIHLGLKCPYTGYHQSCPTGQIPRAFDCLCHNKEIYDDVCSYVHISTHYDANRYVDWNIHMSDEDRQRSMEGINEIFQILNPNIGMI